jgi:hypothetical protein
MTLTSTSPTWYVPFVRTSRRIFFTFFKINYLFIYLYIYLFIYLFVCLFIYLYCFVLFRIASFCIDILGFGLGFT